MSDFEIIISLIEALLFMIGGSYFKGNKKTEKTGKLLMILGYGVFFIVIAYLMIYRAIFWHMQ